MKVVILAGGLGTRLSEETSLKPKPMVEIGGMPIIWHIMKLYSHYGYHDFIICLGYKGYVIKEYFANYFLHMADVTIDMSKNDIHVHRRHAEPWRITLVNTGAETMTGGRVKRIAEYVGSETFMMTYGDGVADINVERLVQTHQEYGLLATVTAVQPTGRFGSLNITDNNRVAGFQEKPQGDGGWINGGFFVLEPAVFDYITGDETIWEREPLEMFAAEGQLSAYYHSGYWKPMDTLRDKNELEQLWQAKKAPWKVW